MTQKTTDQILLDAIHELKEDVGRIDRDLAKDRNINEKLAMAVNGSTEQINQFAKRLETIENRFHDKMVDVAAPIIESVDNLTTVIEDKKMSAEKMSKIKTKSWWQLWK